jgi:predicted acyl esterase
VPILITDAWQDKFFNAAGMIKATRLLKAPFLAYFGAVDGHGSDTSFAENNFISKWDNHWFEHWFLNLCPNLFDSALFHYASTVFPVTNNHWSFKHLSSKTWPPEIEVPLRLYLQPKRKLEGFICKIFSDTAGFWNDIKDSTFTMQEAINTSFKEPFYSSRFSKNTLEFDSNPLVTDIQFTGIPILRLFYSSTADLCQYNAQIWEVKPSGESHFVTRINYTDRHYIQGTLKEKIIEGPANSHSFRHGNKIRVIFTNLDTQPEDSFLSSNPFVLPVLKKAYNTIYFGKEKPSYIELPVIESVDSIQSPINIFSTLQLFQNYPNPFNPLTNIRYNLKKRSHVELKIYDFLGKKRVTLVHSVQLPGTHIVSLNSNTANLSSGVYFYEVKVGDAVKRMKMVVSN